MIDLSENYFEIEEFAKNNKLELIIEKEHNGSVPKDKLDKVLKKDPLNKNN